MNIALFDLDHTLLPIDSDFTWSVFTNAIGWTDPEATARQNEQFYQQYVAGTLDMGAYIRFVMAPVCARPPHEVRAAHDQYLRDHIVPQIRPEALALLQHHREAGDTLLLTTATNRFIAGPIGTRLGFADEHIIATELARDAQGRYSGDIDGEPNLRDGKVRNLAHWLHRRGLDWGDVHLTFYSDSYNDLPLLERAQRPVATNPDQRLRPLAQQRGWRILDLFPTH